MKTEFSSLLIRIKNAILYRCHCLFNRTDRRARLLLRYDSQLFRQHSGSFAKESREAKLAEIAMAFHVIEKGLTMPNRRYGFGHDALYHLMFCIKRFEELYGHDDVLVLHAIGVVREYLSLHKKASFDFSKDPEFWARIEDFDRMYAAFPVTTQLHLKRDDLFGEAEAPFPAFAASRHTCRHFAGELPLETVEKAVKLAMTAPSACNRQHVRVHCVSNHELRDQIYSLQNGNRGFGKYADKLLVIAADLHDLRWDEERNDIYTNAGIFIMNLCYALHYYHVASCILNWSVGPESDVKMLKLLGIPSNERIAALIACGPAPDEVDIAMSPRKRLEDIFTNHA